MFFPLPYPNIKKCNHKENTTSWILKVIPLWDLFLNPAVKSIRSQFSSYSFASRSKHHQRHKHTVQVVRKRLPKISQALRGQASYLRPFPVLQGPVRHLSATQCTLRGLLWRSVLSLSCSNYCVCGCRLCVVTWANNKALWFRDNCPLREGRKVTGKGILPV